MVGLEWYPCCRLKPTTRWPSGTQVERGLSQLVYRTATVHRLRESSLNMCTGRPPTGVMIPDAV